MNDTKLKELQEKTQALHQVAKEFNKVLDTFSEGIKMLEYSTELKRKMLEMMREDRELKELYNLQTK